MKKLALILGILFCAMSAGAQCTGSGTAWSCPSGTTTAQLQTAINAASNNAVITFANGTYTWASWVQFSATNGVTLICASGATCTVNSTGTVLGFSSFSGTLTNLYRVSGFTFVTSNTGQAIFWFDATSPGGRGVLDQVRIDHNTFTLGVGANIVIFVGDTASNTYMYGVADHNSITAQNAVAFYFPISQFDSSPPSSPQGQSNNFFLEDNIFTVISNTNASVPCFTDGWGFEAMVIRHNTVTNCSIPVHDLGHAGGMENWEVYNNQFILNSGASTIGISDGYRMLHDQGAQEEMFFNNTFAPLTEPHNGDTLSALADYVDMSCSGIPYPCLGSNPTYGPQPGRSATGVLKPIYGWNNSDAVNGTIVATASEEGTTIFVAPNRDLYDAVSITQQTSPTSPFNGTVGVGIGTLANRPTTCTHSNATFPTLVGDGTNGGVGYAAFTTAGTIGASVGEGTASDVVLYNCGATNTWSTWYTPYTYPHPLVNGGGGNVILSPSSQSFGSVNTGSSSTSVTFTLSNSSGVTATGISPITTGGNSGDFTVSNTGAGSCSAAGGTLTNGSSCTFTVTFTPLALGARATTLSASYSGGDGLSPQSASLSGTGTTPSSPSPPNPLIVLNSTWTAVPLPAAAPTPPAPLLTGTSPLKSYVNSSGQVSQDGKTFAPLTIRFLGNNFTAGPTAIFDGKTVTASFVNSTEIDVAVPAAMVSLPGASPVAHSIAVSDPAPAVPAPPAIPALN